MAEWNDAAGRMNLELIRLGDSVPVFTVPCKVFSVTKNAFKSATVTVTRTFPAFVIIAFRNIFRITCFSQSKSFS